MSGLIFKISVKRYQLLLICLLVLSLILRLYNINYNSPFNDEAIYQVIGNLGVYKWDWYSYNAPAWVAGSIFVYPTLSALAGSFGGVVGARILNVILGVLAVETVFSLGSLLPSWREKPNYLAGIISAAILGGATVTYFVSRLATYDMPSFYLLLLSFYLLARAWRIGSNSGRWYFLSGLVLVLAVLTKIIVGLYVLPVLAVGFIVSRRRGRANFKLWRGYFLLPVILLLGAYGVLSYGALLSYAKVQAAREYFSLSQIAGEFFSATGWAWLWWAVGSLGLIYKRRIELWATLTSLALLPLGFHLATHRLATLDKHVFLSVAFLALAAGIGISYLLKSSPRVFRYTLSGFLPLVLGFYLFTSYTAAQTYNNQWVNTYPVTRYLNQNLAPHDKILAEAGASAILAAYPLTPPANVTTFDWLDYKGKTGRQAYEDAVLNGYFNYVQLFNNPPRDDVFHGDLYKVVKENLYGYQLDYFDANFSIYKRLY